MKIKENKGRNGKINNSNNTKMRLGQMDAHHGLTALLYFYTRACKCQLFTDEGSRRLPKRLNYCFSVLASATNRSI